MTRQGAGRLASASERGPRTSAALAEAAEALDGAQRTFGGLAQVGFAMAVIFASSLHPAVERAIGVSPAALGGAIGAMLVAIAAATVAFYAAGGRSRAFALAERVETVVIAAGVLALAYVSGGRALFWMLYLVYALLMGAMALRARFHMIVMGAGASAVTVAFVALARDPGAAVMSAVAGAFAVNLIYVLTRSARRLAETTAEREALAAELGRVRVEEERRRIARDLHDGVAGDLSALAARIDDLRDGLAARREHALDAELERMRDRSARSVEELRSIVWALRSPDGSWGETIAYAAARCAELCPPEVALRFSAGEADVMLDGALRLDLVRVLQEAVRNAVRHGAPRAIEVGLRTEGKDVVLTIEDDGAGVAAARLSELAGRDVGGLSNMSRRAVERGGAFALDAGRGGRGLRVLLRLPATGFARLPDGDHCGRAAE